MRRHQKQIRELKVLRETVRHIIKHRIAMKRPSYEASSPAEVESVAHHNTIENNHNRAWSNKNKSSRACSPKKQSLLRRIKCINYEE